LQNELNNKNRRMLQGFLTLLADIVSPPQAPSAEAAELPTDGLEEMPDYLKKAVKEGRIRRVTGYRYFSPKPKDKRPVIAVLEQETAGLFTPGEQKRNKWERIDPMVELATEHPSGEEILFCPVGRRDSFFVAHLKVGDVRIIMFDTPTVGSATFMAEMPPQYKDLESAMEGLLAGHRGNVTSELRGRRVVHARGGSHSSRVRAALDSLLTQIRAASDATSAP
jgi:hypothetical protein